LSIAGADVLSVQKSPLERDLIEKVEPIVHNLGYSLRDLQVVSGGHATVRVFLDVAEGSAPVAVMANSPDEPTEVGGTIGIEDCSRVHEAIGPMFDVWDPIKGPYTLEVSSPGERAPLRLLRHFQEALEGGLKIETIEPLPVPPPAKPRRRWEGTLKAVHPEGEIVLADETGEHVLKLVEIKSAQWLRDWSVTASPSAPKGKRKVNVKKVEN
jgi:ribosome maturation factor RimP